MPRPLSLALLAIWAALFAASGLWSHFSADPFPLPGMRQLAAADPLNRWLQVSAVLLAAIGLAVGSWQTRGRLRLFQGLAVALFLLGFVSVGVPFGLAFACFAIIAKQSAGPAPNSHS